MGSLIYLYKKKIMKQLKHKKDIFHTDCIYVKKNNKIKEEIRNA